MSLFDILRWTHVYRRFVYWNAKTKTYPTNGPILLGLNLLWSYDKFLMVVPTSLGIYFEVAS